MRAVSIWLVLATSAAHADPLAEARQLQQTLEYEQALAIVDREIARGGLERGRLAELHELAGELAAGLDRKPQAFQHFAIAYELHEFHLPAGTSPKIQEPADQAQGLEPRLRLAAHRTVDPASRAPAVGLSVHADTLHLVVGIAVRVVDADGQERELVARDARIVVPPPGSRVLEVIALDAAADRLWTGTLTEASTPRAPDPSLLARPVTWGVATVVVAVAAGLCAWKTSSLQSQWNSAQDGTHDYSELTSLESRGKSYALAADIGFGLAALTAAATVFLYLRDPAPRPPGVLVQF